MLENRYEIFDANNNKFIVFKTPVNFVCKKVLANNSMIDPTIDELTFIIEELKKIKQAQTVLNYDQALAKIKEFIDNGTLKNPNEIENYINNLQLNAVDKQKLFEQSKSYLENKIKITTPVTQLRDKIIEHLRKEKQAGTFLVANFSVIDNMTGPSYYKISLDSYNNAKKINLEMESLDYNEELKKELIEPVIEEIVLSSEVTEPTITPVPGGIYRSNLNLTSKDNKITQLHNIEEEYANKLDQHVKKLMSETKINDHSMRDERITELQEEKELEKGNTRKRIKPVDSPESKGFSNSYLLYGIISLTSALLIILQIFFIS